MFIEPAKEVDVVLTRHFIQRVKGREVNMNAVRDTFKIGNRVEVLRRVKQGKTKMKKDWAIVVPFKACFACKFNDDKRELVLLTALYPMQYYKTIGVRYVKIKSIYAEDIINLDIADNTRII